LTTLRSDVLVLGSTLGGLVAATYLARAGLRVILVEEAVHAERPPLLREPFLLSGLQRDGQIHRVLREIALPLIDRRELRVEEVALQVVLRDARVDIYPGEEDLATELEAFGFASKGEALGWLEQLRTAADRAREGLWDDPVRSRVPARAQYLPPRITAPSRTRAPIPGGSSRLMELAETLSSALAMGAGSADSTALLVSGACQGVFRAPDVGRPFLDLFRHRFHTLHGEIRTAGAFALVGSQGEVGVELPRGEVFARGLVIAAPHEPLRRFVQESGPVPRWLRSGVASVPLVSRLFRANTSSLPVGMATRVVVGSGAPEELLCISRHPDPAAEGVEWLLISGPGAAKLDDQNPLGELAPFPGTGIVPVDTGPSPRWDLDAQDLSFAGPDRHPLTRNRPPIVSVGPGSAPELGFEGEILQARRMALRLARRLGAPRTGV
jgi:hypothetical protein